MISVTKSGPGDRVAVRSQHQMADCSQPLVSEHTEAGLLQLCRLGSLILNDTLLRAGLMKAEMWCL